MEPAQSSSGATGRGTPRPVRDACAPIEHRSLSTATGGTHSLSALRMTVAMTLLTLMTSTTNVGAQARPTVYDEPLRPQFHFTSSSDWLNDPNGLVFYEGEYHLFFQRVPGSNDGNTAVKSWGHAVSADLVHWKQLDDAILPDANGSIWSGSAVVDGNNTSGFGRDGKPPLIAIYTRMDDKNTSDQRLAYSTDKGRTWTKYDKAVVPHINGINRDPKVIWHEPTKQWVMALYLDERHHFALYTSPNLKDWTKLQDVTLEGDDECPDFFPPQSRWRCDEAEVDFHRRKRQVRRRPLRRQDVHAGNRRADQATTATATSTPHRRGATRRTAGASRSHGCATGNSPACRSTSSCRSRAS